jgi:hypothetical protein
MSRGTSAHRVIHLLSLVLLLGTCLAAPARADDQNQRRKHQQQQQQQPGQPQQPVYRPNVAPQRPSYQPPQQPYVQQQRFPATQFQPAQPRTVINPNAPTYRAPVANPNVPSRFSNGPNDFHANPNAQGQTFRQAPAFVPGTGTGRMPMPVTPTPTMPGRVVPINGAQGAGQSTLTRRDVLSSPEDREFMRGLSAQQRQSLDQLTPGQIQSLQQSGQWPAAKQAILAGRSPPQATQSGAIANPNGSAKVGAPTQTIQTPAGNTSNTASTANTANASTASGASPSNMGPTAGATDMAPPPPGGGTAGAPVGPPPASQTPLNILAFPSNLSASGGGAFQPTIYLNGSGFTTMTQIVWTCTMPSGQACTASPYNWTPSAWSGKYVVNSDTSAMVAPHLLAGGDPAGVYQWTVSFVGNGGKSFVFQVNNAGSAAPPPALPPPPPPVTTQPPPPPVASNPPQPTYPPPPVSANPTTPPPPVPSGQAMYIESGTGTQLTADQIRSGTFPPGTFFIQSGTGQQVTQAQLLGTQQVSNNNPPVSQPAPPSLPPSAPAPVQPPTTIAPVSATLRVSGVQPFYYSNGGPYQPFINLSGGGFNSISQIVWTCVMPSGQPCTASPYVWTPATWSGKFSRYSDSSAVVVPMLLAGGDPGGTYQWTVSFFGNGQTSLAFQVSNAVAGNATPVSQQTSAPSAAQPTYPVTSSFPSSSSSSPSIGNMSQTTPMFSSSSGVQYTASAKPALSLDASWVALLPPVYQQQLLSIPDNQITSMKQAGTWSAYQMQLDAQVGRDMGQTAQKVLFEAATSTPSSAGNLYGLPLKQGETLVITGLIDANKINHVFGDPEHKLEGLVKEFGSQEEAFSAIEQAIQREAIAQGIQGAFDAISVSVGSYIVEVSGIVIGGIARVGTAFIP